MRVGYFGPEGTYTYEAMLSALHGEAVQEVALATIHDAVMAVHTGDVQRAMVPIENSVEGSVNATLDALAFETEDVVIVGETVLAIHHCLVARTELEPAQIEVVVSHPQANAQCARFLRTELPQARVAAGVSTADAVRTVAAHDGPWAALGPRIAAERYGCRVLRADVEDAADNVTRFVWLARADADVEDATTRATADGTPARHKTAIVFWPRTSDAPGWLVSCLAEFGGRGVNLTRIESRPRKQALGSYMFFVDLDGRADDEPVAAGLEALSAHVDTVRVLGSFPAA
jgi:prephenate dehydratase